MHEKYTAAVQMLNSFVIAHAAREATIDSFGELLSFMMENFADPSKLSKDVARAEREEVIKFLEGTATGPEILEVLQKIPPEISEIAWPVYVTRLLVRDLRCIEFVAHSAPFTKFATRYSKVIF